MPSDFRGLTLFVCLELPSSTLFFDSETRFSLASPSDLILKLTLPACFQSHTGILYTPSPWSQSGWLKIIDAASFSSLAFFVYFGKALRLDRREE